METRSPQNPGQPLTSMEAQQLLRSVPARPERELTPVDHLSALATIILSLTSGLLALSGHPWWAVAPTIVALVTSHTWIARRQRRANEPRMKAAFTVTVFFTVWMMLPVWRGISRGETIPFPEAWIFAGLAPAVWLAYYVVLLVRR